VNAAEQVYGVTPSTYAAGTASAWNAGQCHDSASAWAAIVPLRTSAASPNIVAWCVDSKNTSKQVSGATAAATLAGSGATQYACP
jgi:putative transposase